MKNITYISAGAGSGKTYRLTQTLADLIINKEVEPEQVILTTFTRKAAAEFKERAKAVLYEKGMYDEASRLDQALIGTIDSIAERIVRKYWFFLGLSPKVELMDENSKEPYIKESIAKIPTEEETEFFYRFRRTFNDMNVNDKKVRGSYFGEDYWQSDLKAIIEKSISFDITSFERSKADSLAILKLLNTDQDIHYTDEAYDLQVKYITKIFDLAAKWKEEFEQYKKERGIVDFCDMEQYMLELFSDEDILKELGNSYTHLLVDEFQDCSPVQVKIFNALAKVMKHSYWVGDTKQAIYGFRASDTQLTKAISDMIQQKHKTDGCIFDTLDECWRSVPDLVNFYNTVFMTVFAGMFGPDVKKQVFLYPAMETHPEKFDDRPRANNPLRYLDIRGNQGVIIAKMAHYIKQVIDEEKVEPKDIAVICRANDKLNSTMAALTEAGVESERAAKLNTGSRACRLISALADLTAYPGNEATKKEIAKLTEENMTDGALLDSKLVFNSTEHGKDEKWLNDIDLIKRALTLQPKIKDKGVGAQVEALVVELDLRRVMARWSEPIDQSMAEAKAVIAAAKSYEESGNTFSGSGIAGFSSYLSSVAPEMPLPGRGVQLCTYHAAKGLEWKYVFLMMDSASNDMSILKNEIYKIHHFHPEEPTMENPFPEMIIRLLPWVYRTDGNNVPEPMAGTLIATDVFNKTKRHMIDESARLMYVGMTRASEVLTLVPGYGNNNRFNWLNNIGLTETNVNSTNGDILGIGIPFKVITANEIPDTNRELTVTPNQYYDYRSEKPSENPARKVSPSSVEGTADKVEVIMKSNDRISINSSRSEDDFSEVGTCIHNIFAAIDTYHTPEEVAREIRDHDMSEIIKKPEEVIRAWNNLHDFLVKRYGTAREELHELPFRHYLENGQIVSGEIDYIYRTDKGDVLIDFKTFPGADNQIINPGNEHYAGLYAGQLNTYAAALKAGGRTVRAKYIYYPTMGVLVKLS